MLPAYARALASLRDDDREDGRPFRVRLDSGLNLAAPSAKRLAAVFALPFLTEDRDLYRQGARILARAKGDNAAPTPLPLTDLADDVRVALELLPEHAEAGERYQDVRLLVTYGDPATVAAYLEAVARAVRAFLSTYRAPRPVAAERGPALTPAEMVKRSRDRAAQIEADSVRAWLADWRESDAPAPGETVDAAALFVRVAEELSDWSDDKRRTPSGAIARSPRRRVFYAVADEVLGPRRRVGKARTAVYTIPADMDRTEALAA